jgi:hypothetical protein
VSTAADREGEGVLARDLDAGGDIVGRFRADDGDGLAVDHAIPDGAGFVPIRVGGEDEGAVEAERL